MSDFGGFWLDATILLTKPIPESIAYESFYTCKTFQEDLPYFSKSRWTGFCLAGAQGYPLYSFLYEMLIAYWLRYNVAIDYLMMDYIIFMGYDKIAAVNRDIDLLPNNNLYRNELMSKINYAYTEAFFDHLNQVDTFLQKLSWGYGKQKKRDRNNNLTNYGFLCLKYLDHDE